MNLNKIDVYNILGNLNLRPVNIERFVNSVSENSVITSWWPFQETTMPFSTVLKTQFTPAVPLAVGSFSFEAVIQQSDVTYLKVGFFQVISGNRSSGYWDVRRVNVASRTAYPASPVFPSYNPQTIISPAAFMEKSIDAKQVNISMNFDGYLAYFQ